MADAPFLERRVGGDDDVVGAERAGPAQDGIGMDPQLTEQVMVDVGANGPGGSGQHGLPIEGLHHVDINKRTGAVAGGEVETGVDVFQRNVRGVGLEGVVDEVEVGWKLGHAVRVRFECVLSWTGGGDIGVRLQV